MIRDLASLDAAVEYIKSEFGEPYRVDWSPVKETADGRAVLYGLFEHVPNYSTEHVGEFDIEEVPLVGATG